MKPIHAQLCLFEEIVVYREASVAMKATELFEYV